MRSTHRLGKPLTAPFDGLFSARKGSHRVIYAIGDKDRAVEVVAIDHRVTAYLAQPPAQEFTRPPCVER